MKLLRVKQIEDNNNKTLVSEGVEGNYMDILNYSVFALIIKSNNSTGEKEIVNNKDNSFIRNDFDFVQSKFI